MKIRENLQSINISTILIHINNFNTFLQAFSSKEILNCDTKDCFKINGKKD